MLLTNAKIWTMEPGVEDIPCGYLRIQDGKIAAIGPMSDAPLAESGEDVWDQQGLLLLPGFIDAHSHAGLCASGLGIEGDDINDDADPVTPHYRALDGIDPFDRVFQEARNAGITCLAVSPGSANPLAGQICALKTMGSQIDTQAVMEPLAIKMALGENPKMTYGAKTQAPVTRMGIAALIREQLAKARRYQDALEQAEAEDEELPEYDAKCEALLPLLRREIPLHIHAHKAYDIFTGIRIAKEFDLRYVIVHGTEGYKIADILAKEKAGVICGPDFNTRTKPELAELTTQNVRLLWEVGIPVAISTDYPEMPQELLGMAAAMAVASGMDSRAALASITIEAAKLLGLEERIGSLAVGKDADIIGFRSEPLTLGAIPELVFVDGNWARQSEN